MTDHRVTTAALGRVINHPNTAPDIVIQAIATELQQHRAGTPPMNDYQTIMAILDKAHIPYLRDITPDPGDCGVTLPHGATSIHTAGLGMQPHEGGTPGNTVELVFGPDRALIAIWAWE